MTRLTARRSLSSVDTVHGPSDLRFRAPGHGAPELPSRPSPARAPLLAALSLGLGLAGCGDGGGAGDETTGDGSFTPNPIEPLVGTWNLGSDWDGRGAEDSGEALLVIRPVGEDGSSEVRVYDFDTLDGCYFPLARGGEAEPDGAFRERVFMNHVFPFDSAELGLDGQTLVIDYFDADDVNGNGDRREQLVHRAEAVGQAETDIISQVCN